MATPVEIAVRATGTAAAARAMGQVETRVSSVGRSVRRAFVGGAAALGVASLVRGVVGLGTSSVQAEAKYSTSMRLIAASTGASSRVMKQLNDQAIDLGAKTSFSAQDAADAMLELAKAGLNTKTIMRGGVAGTLTLAAAGGTDLGTAATIAANALNTFNLSGRKTKQVAAALAGGANASTASVESLGQGLRQVGPGATNAGLSLQETVAALSAFDAAGVKGQDAGTSLKTMLARLVPQTDKAATAMEGLGLKFTKSDGSFQSLTNISEQLHDRLGKLSDAQRTTALNTIFGSDASRAATVLMKEGAGGIRKYIKATNDQGAAQKVANARMGGTAGTLERISGAVETAKLRIGQELAPLVQRAGTAFADHLVPGIEAGIRAGKQIGHTLAPAISAVVDLLGDLLPSGKEAGSIFNDVLLPALKLFSHVVEGAAKAVDAIPDPIKSIGVEAAIVALVLPRLSGAVTGVTTTVATNIARLQQWRAELTYTATRAEAVSTVTSRLGGVARTAAGVGGIALLTSGLGDLSSGASTTDKALGVLGETAGGALTGFAVGGPIGAAIGGGIGLMHSLVGAIEGSSDAAKGAVDPTKKYAGAIDAIANASGRAARAEALRLLQSAGMVSSSRQLGIQTDTLISALLGEPGAIDKVNNAWRKHQGVTDAIQLKKVTDFLTDQGFALDEHRSKIDRDKAAIKGLDKTTQATPRSIRELNKALGRTGDAKVDKTWFNSVNSMLGTSVKVSRDKSGRISFELKAGTGKARANLAPFRTSLSGGLSALAGPGGMAHSGGSRIGAAIGSGVSSGLMGSIRGIIGAAQAAVAAGLRAAHQRAEAKSPSRVTQRLGHYMGDGLAKGLDDSHGKVAKSAVSLVDRVLKAAGQGADDLHDALVHLLTSHKLKGDALKRAMHSLENESKVLNANAAAQRRVNAALSKAREHLKDLVQQSKEYAASIREGVIATGDLTQLGKDEAGTATTTGIIDQLRGKVRDAQRFADLIKQLTKSNLNATSLRQLLAAGVEGGLSTAEALIAGGSSAIDQINQLTAQLNKAGTGLGDSTAETLYGAGIKAAQGLVDGLEKQGKALDKIADRLAARLVAALRKALRMKSPSQVMRNVGRLTAEGLVIGLNDVHVERDGRQLATDLVSGFGTPRLTARAAFGEVLDGGSGSTLDIRLSADQVGQLQQGKQIQITVDSARKAGVRRLNVR